MSKSRARSKARKVLALSLAAAVQWTVLAQEPEAPMVQDVEVQFVGGASLAREKVLANMQTRVGKKYDERVVEDDIRNLYATGNVNNVRIYGERRPDGVKVIVVLQAKAKVGEVLLSGVQKLKEGRIRKEIGTKPGDVLNEASIEADRQKVLDYYAGKGFTEVEVRTRIQSDEAAGTASVSFEVQEGDKVEIRAVRFEGNSAVSTGDLRKAVKTKPKNMLSFLTKSGRVNADQLEQDAIAIRELYQDRGYVDVEVAPARVERSGSEAEVVFELREGRQYRVGKVTYSGAQVITADELAAKAKVQEGAIYSPQKVRADIKGIQDLYGIKGYVDLQAIADTTLSGEGVIDVAFQVEEGAQNYVQHVNIIGNVRTKDKVIRREMAVQPGDIYNTVRVDASKQRLQNLNYFSKVDIFPGDTLVPGRKDVNVTVEEKRTGNLMFGAGFSSIDSLLGFAEISQSNFDLFNWPNFTGGGQRFRIRTQYGTRRKDFVISLTEPYFMDYRVSLGGELFYREASFVSTVYNERRYGFDLNSRKALNDFLSARVGYRIENIGIFDLDPGVSKQIREEEGDRVKSQIYSGLTYDTRDSVFLTRKGERVDFQAFVAGGPLAGKTDIYGFSLEGAKYFNFKWDTILTINAEIGNVTTWAGGDRVPIFDRLYLGGANNLRGFRFRDVGPKDDDGQPIGGLSLARATIEYTFPVIDKVRGALFYDVGMVGEGSYSYNGDLNSDIGIGVRLELPIGPVRIDYGIPVQTDPFNNSGGRFQFNIGYQF
jgi:outer membrane protein insertion porin family